MRERTRTNLLTSTICIATVIAFTSQAAAQGRNSRGLSLDPERTISFMTTEGTYMNLDVSPDGRTIVFDLLGDIYTVPVNGGSATRLTSGLAYDIQPVFSPDGRSIAFISDKSGSDNIWRINADGTEPKAVTTDRERPLSTPEWTPDGKYIAARRRGDLWLYHIDGGSGMSLTESPLASGLTGPRVSSDGRYVFFSSRGGGGGGGGIGGFTNWQVRRLDRHTGDVASITSSPNGAYRPTVSADGRWLVYGARLDAKTGLRVRDLMTDRERWLIYDIDRDNAERAGTLDIMPRFDFLPNGEDIIIATGGTFHRINLTSGENRTISFSAEVNQELGPLVYFETEHNDESLRIRNIRYANRNAAGDRLIFSALGKLWLKRIPNGEATRVLSSQVGQFQPVFSPDGRHVVYITWDDVEGGHVWKAPVNGNSLGTPQRLTEYPGYYMHPAWSDDGTKIALIKEDAAQFRNIWSRNTGIIAWMDAGGGPLNEVTSAPSDNRLTFSPDGSRLSYVASARGGTQAQSELVTVRLDGTDKRTLANISAETFEAVPSPNNDYVAFAVREDIYVAALPLSATPPEIGEARGPGPVKRVTREGGVDIHWERDSQTLAWTFADTFYRIAVDSVFATASASTDSTASPDSTATGDAAGPNPIATVIDIIAPKHKPRGTVALVGANVISMEREEVLRDATVLIRDNRIAEVGPRNAIRIPDGTETVDVTGQYIVPGFVDIHAHLRPPRDVFVETSWAYIANMAYGVTTTRDVSTSNDSFGYSELVETGAMLGPRIYSTGRAMTTTNAKIESLDDARAMVRHYKKLGTNVIKQYMQPHRRQRQWVIQAAQEEGMNVTNEGGGDFRLNMTQILDGYTGFEHSLPIANLYGDVIRFVAESGTWYTPTLVVSYGGPTAEWYFYQTTEVHDDAKLANFTPHDDLDRRTRRGQMNAIDEYHFPAVARGAAKILQQGGKVALGAHGEQQGIGAHWEIWALQMGGLSNFDALRTATTIAAEGLGLQDELGTITVGKLADLIVLRANPLENIRNTNTISLVMKNGELFDGDTMDKLWPERVPRPSYGYRVVASPPVPERH